MSEKDNVIRGPWGKKPTGKESREKSAERTGENPDLLWARRSPKKIAEAKEAMKKSLVVLDRVFGNLQVKSPEEEASAINLLPGLPLRALIAMLLVADDSLLRLYPKYYREVCRLLERRFADLGL